MASPSVGTMEITKYTALHLRDSLDVLAGHRLLSPVTSSATVKIIAFNYKPQTFHMGNLRPALHLCAFARQLSYLQLGCKLPFC